MPATYAKKVLNRVARRPKHGDYAAVVAIKGPDGRQRTSRRYQFDAHAGRVADRMNRLLKHLGSPNQAHVKQDD